MPSLQTSWALEARVPAACWEGRCKRAQAWRSSSGISSAKSRRSASLARSPLATCTWPSTTMASPNVASKCGVTCSGGQVALPDVALRGKVTSPDVASKCGVTCPHGVRQPGGIAGAVLGFTPMASGRGVRTWRQRSTWRRRPWRQEVASGARPPGKC